MLDPDMLGALARHWGFPELLPHQAHAMKPILEGRDSLVVLPTGGGKSLCYQLPAVARGQLALVISPLVALMQDQVANMRAIGVPAAALYADMDPETRRAVGKDALEGRLRLLYLSPESLESEGMQQFIGRLPLAYAVIDEAHCISQWGHDYRESYRGLGRLKRLAPGRPLHAFTATATAAVRQDILKSLEMADPDVVVGNLHRPNLTFRFQHRHDTLGQILEVLGRHRGEAGIIYAPTRRQVEKLAESLVRKGWAARPYHAGLDADLKRRTLEDFRQERLDLVVATVAFGMGIDRGDVRFVIHAGLPRSLEQYVQEAGRAGRDRLEAECVLLHGMGDVLQWERLISISDPELFRHQRQQLRDMYRFVQALSCRHAALGRHFGQEPSTDTCGSCDVCLGEHQRHPDGTTLARKLLSGVGRLRPSHGAQMVTDVLLGKTHQALRDKGFDQLAVHGLLKGQPPEAVRDWLDQLAGLGLVRVDAEHSTLHVTAAAASVLTGNAEVNLSTPRKVAARPTASRTTAGQELGPHDQELFAVLRAWRREQAQRQALPAYCVFSDAVLRELAVRRPTDAVELASVRGVGERRAERYGPSLLPLLAKRVAALSASP